MKRSYIIAGGMLAAVILWLLSGLLWPSRTPAPDSGDKGVPGITRVEVQRFEAEPVIREVVVQGQSVPLREVVVKAEIGGEVTELLAEKGQQVSRSDVLLRLQADDRPEQLEQARALLQQRKLEYQAALSLKQKGLQAERQVAEAMSLLRSAEALLKSAELNLQRLTVRAPFEGMVQARHAELGDFLQPGDPLYTLVALDPLRVRGDVAEGEIAELESGMGASAELSNGVVLNGKVTFVASVADSSTRTFALEMEAPNPGSRQRAGMSATLRIPLGSINAHKVSPALLSLNDAGVLGLKGVDQGGIVRFHPVELLKSERDGVWLGGLPPQVELITVGQDFVREGDRVEKAPAGR